MKLTQIFFITAITGAMLSCNSNNPNEQVDKGTIEKDTYTCEEIGWTISIPKGFEITPLDEVIEGEEQGLEIIEDMTGEVDMSGLVHLISFQKNEFNCLESSYEEYSEEFDGDYEEHNKFLHELVYDAYANEGIDTDTATSRVMINNYEFELFSAIIYDPNGNKLLEQEMYSRLINNVDFCVTISFTNEDYGDIMRTALMESKFKK